MGESKKLMGGVTVSQNVISTSAQERVQAKSSKESTVLGGIPHKDDYEDYNSSISFSRNPDSRYAKQAKKFADQKADIELSREGNTIYATNKGKSHGGRYIVGYLEKGKAGNGAPALVLRHWTPENAMRGLSEYQTTTIKNDQDLKTIAVNKIHYSTFWKSHKAKK